MTELFSLLIEIPGIFYDKNITLCFFDNKPITKQIGAYLNGEFKNGKRISLGIEDEFKLQLGKKTIIVPQANRLNQETRNRMFLLAIVDWLFEEYDENTELITTGTKNIAKTFRIESLTYLNFKNAIEKVFNMYEMKDIELDDRTSLPTNSYKERDAEYYRTLIPNKKNQHPPHPFRN